MKRAVIVAGGEAVPPQWLREQAGTSDLLIAADRGGLYALEAGLVPHRVVGDFDSIPPEALDRLRHTPTALEMHPIEKDESDLELALRAALAADVSNIDIYCAFGGRLDHLLTNVLLLTQAATRNVPCRLRSPSVDAFCVVEQPTIVEGAVGDLLTLVPLSKTVYDVSLQGVKYPLTVEPLFRGESRGLSNEFKEPRVRIRAAAGLLLVVHTRRGDGRT